MVNINAQRNLPPDNTPWGKAIEKRISDLERSNRLAVSELRNISQSLDTTISRVNQGVARRLIPHDGVTTGQFPVPLMPPTSVDYNPQRLATYDVSNVRSGKHLAMVLMSIDDRSTFRLEDNSASALQQYSIETTMTLTTDQGLLWNYSKYIPLTYRNWAGDTYWSTPVTNFIGIEIMDLQKTDELYLNVDSYRLFYGGNQIVPGGTINVFNMRVILFG